MTDSGPLSSVFVFCRESGRRVSVRASTRSSYADTSIFVVVGVEGKGVPLGLSFGLWSSGLGARGGAFGFSAGFTASFILARSASHSALRCAQVTTGTTGGSDLSRSARRGGNKSSHDWYLCGDGIRTLVGDVFFGRSPKTASQSRPTFARSDSVWV